MQIRVGALAAAFVVIARHLKSVTQAESAEVITFQIT